VHLAKIDSWISFRSLDRADAMDLWIDLWICGSSPHIYCLIRRKPLLSLPYFLRQNFGTIPQDFLQSCCFLKRQAAKPHLAKLLGQLPIVLTAIDETWPERLRYPKPGPNPKPEIPKPET
jgi:hypothetical protein